MDELTPRQQILQAVNRFALAFRRHNSARGFVPPTRLYGSRNINEAVCVARRRKLVAPEVLEAAGFRREERRR